LSIATGVGFSTVFPRAYAGFKVKYDLLHVGTPAEIRVGFGSIPAWLWETLVSGTGAV